MVPIQRLFNLVGTNPKLRPRWKGPYLVTDLFNEVNAILKADGRSRKTKIVHLCCQVNEVETVRDGTIFHSPKSIESKPLQIDSDYIQSTLDFVNRSGNAFCVNRIKY